MKSDVPAFVLKNVSDFSIQQSWPLPDQRIERVEGQEGPLGSGLAQNCYQSMNRITKLRQVLQTSCKVPAPNLPRFFTFNDEFIFNTEKARDTARANVGELRVAFIRNDTFERRMSTIDDQMNRRHRLRCVTKQRRVEVVDRSVQRPA